MGSYAAVKPIYSIFNNETVFIGGCHATDVVIYYCFSRLETKLNFDINSFRKFFKRIDLSLDFF